MKIRHVSIKKYKNLKDFDCVFSDSNISAFIGNNGSGKSNLLETITSVFSFAKSVVEKNNPRIIVTPDVEDYVIEYENEGLLYVLEGSGAVFNIYHENKLLRGQLSQEVALPETIMLYYAGETRRQYYIAKRTFDVAYDNKLKRIDNAGFIGFKYLDYYSIEDLNLLLLTAAVFQGEYYEKLLSLINCSSILLKTKFELKNPSGKRSGKNADEYWGARGFIKSFLDEIRRFVSATVDLSDIYYMSFQDISPIKDLCTNEADMFAKLKALKNAGYLESLTVSLCGINGEELSYEELSEGEKQLSLLLLLTTFTAKSNCLYLFDEFDAYLHLNWQRQFSQMLRETNVQGHILFTTHSSATISQLRSDELFIMKDGTAEIPGSETYNRALDEIMTEQMGVTMRTPEIEALYDEFKQFIADKDKEGALQVVQKLKDKLDESDPLFDRIRLNLRRI